MPAVLYLLLEEGIQPVTDYDNDSFDSSVDCNDQATSCTTDCTDADADAVSDCLDLCIDNDFDGYGIDNSASIIGNGSVSVSECTVYGSDPCILNESCYGSDCDDVFDNDCDGLVDTNDPDCEGQMTCADYIDKGSCNLDPACEWVGNPNSGICQDAATCIPDETPEATCDDGIDNDCDGLTDCTDTADCGGDPACQGMPCNT